MDNCYKVCYNSRVMSIKKPQLSSPSEAIGHIKQCGDSHDTDTNNSTTEFNVGIAASGITTALIGSANGPPVVQLAQGVCLVVPLAGLTMAAYRKLVSNKAEKVSTQVQSLAQEAFNGETVDVFKAGKQLAIRWYDLDAPGIETQEIIGRSERIIETAREHSIDLITVGNGYFSDSEYGTVMHGATAIGETKKEHESFRIPPYVAFDPESDVDVRSFTVDEFVETIKRLETLQESTLLGDIIDQLQSSTIKQLYDYLQMDPSNEAIRRDLLLEIRTSLERDNSDIELALHRDSNGALHRLPVTTVSVINSPDNVTQWHHSSDPTTGRETVQLGNIATLAQSVGCENESALLALCKSRDLKNIDMDKLLASAYILLSDSSDRANANYKNLGYDTSTPTDTRAFLDGPIFKRRGSQFAENKLRERLFIFLSAVSVVGGYAVGLSVSNLADHAYDRESERYETYLTSTYPDSKSLDTSPITDNKRYKEYLKSDRPWRSHIDYATFNSIFSWQDFNNEISKSIAEKIIETFPNSASLVEDVVPFARDAGYLKWLSGVEIDAPPEMYTQAGSEAFTGDVILGKNRAIYSLTSLDGTETTGYWYRDTYNSIWALENPRHGVSLSYNTFDVSSETIPTLNTIDDVLAQQPSIMVETPYIGLYRGAVISGFDESSLPIRSDMEILGAFFIDAENPEDYTPIEIRKTGSGMIVAQTTEALGNVRNKRYTKPVLRYWLKKAEKAQTIKPENTKRMDAVFISKNDEAPRNYDNFNTAERSKIAIEVRKALGLSATATEAEVYKAVKDNHSYSYTPFADSKTKININESEGSDIVSEYGAILANLESLNCNLAATLSTLATLDTASTRLVTGFMADSGDNYLSSSEAHAWLVDQGGQIIDTTPYGAGVEASGVLPPESPPSQKQSFAISPLQAAEILGGAIISVMAYRRRKEIAKATDKAVAQLALGSKGQQVAYNQVLHSLYGDPNSSFTPRKQSDKRSLPEMARGYVHNVPRRDFKTFGPRTGLIKLADGSVRRYRFSLPDDKLK